MDADLWDAGVDLEAAMAGAMRPSRVARLLLARPPGSAIWQELGGWQALTGAEVQLVMLRHLTVQVNSDPKKPAPKEPRPPIGLIEQRAREAERRQRIDQNAPAHRAMWDDPEVRAEMEARLAAWGDITGRAKAREQHQAVAARMRGWADPPPVEAQPNTP